MNRAEITFRIPKEYGLHTIQVLWVKEEHRTNCSVYHLRGNIGRYIAEFTAPSTNIEEILSTANKYAVTWVKDNFPEQ